MIAVWMTILAGCMVGLGGISVGLMQMLGAPDRPNYPKIGSKMRLLMFWASGFMLARAVQIITEAQYDTPVLLGPVAIATGFLINALFIGAGAMFLQSRASVRTHNLISRLQRMARCAPSDGVLSARLSATESGLGTADTVPNAVASLRLAGVRVAAPNEGPEAFTGPWQ